MIAAVSKSTENVESLSITRRKRSLSPPDDAPKAKTSRLAEMYRIDESTLVFAPEEQPVCANCANRSTKLENTVTHKQLHALVNDIARRFTFKNVHQRRTKKRSDIEAIAAMTDYVIPLIADAAQNDNATGYSKPLHFRGMWHIDRQTGDASMALFFKEQDCDGGHELVWRILLNPKHNDVELTDKKSCDAFFANKLGLDTYLPTNGVSTTDDFATLLAKKLTENLQRYVSRSAPSDAKKESVDWLGSLTKRSECVQ